MKIHIIIVILLVICSCHQDNKSKFNLAQYQDSIQRLIYCNNLKNYYRVESPTAFKTLKLNKGDTFNLLSGLDFNTGKWVVLLSTGSFMEKSFGQKSGGFYYLDQIEEMKQLQEEIKVTYGGADCCTTEEELVFIRNDSVAFWTGFISGKYGGFQNKNYGWTEPVDSTIFKRIFKRFKLCTKFPPKQTSQ